MALRFLDSFEHYDTDQIPYKYNAVISPGSGLVEISTSSPRSGSQCLRMSSGRQLKKTLDSQSSWVFGFGLKLNTHPSSGTARILVLQDGSTVQCELRVNTSGQLEVRRNNTLLTNGTGSTVLSTGVWYYVEWKVTIANSISANSCKVRVNNVDEITVATSQDTQNGTASTADNFVFWGDTIAIFLDDLYVFDGTGSTNNDFVGSDVRVACLTVSSAGDSTQWTPSAGNNYQNVDETLVDSDTSYNESSTDNQTDLFNMTSMSSATVFGVQVSYAARKTDAGKKAIKSAIKIGGTEYYGSDVSLPEGYLFHSTVYDTNPNSGSAWTSSNVNSTQAGYKLVD